VITVGGTNGKGSCVAYLEAMLSAAGYRVGAYTSPHLLRYNERIRVAGTMISDVALCTVFQRIESARGDVPLTYFEYGTLAALATFQEAKLDAVLLEVGLGGRLDAVNMIDADVALVASIGIDHTDWLGPDRESIGHEKAGIFRAGKPVVCGDPEPPQSLIRQADILRTPLFQLNRQFHIDKHELSWNWLGWESRRQGLPLPRLRGTVQLHNAASCIAVLQLLDERLPVSDEAIGLGLHKASVPARFQLVDGAVPVILDVAHNAEACAALAQNLETSAGNGRTFAVAGMLRDKPLAAIGRVMDAQVDAWYLGSLRVAGRELDATELAQALAISGEVSCHDSVPLAFAAAQAEARPGDRIVVFGSFHTVEAVLRLLSDG